MKVQFKSTNAICVSMCLLLAIATIITSIQPVYAADVIPVIPTQNEYDVQEAIDSVEADPIIKDSAIQMVTTKTVEAYIEPNEDSKAIFNITGGTLIDADIHSLGNEFITAVYNNRICYIKCNNLKAVVGATDAVTEKIEAIYNRYAFPGEKAVEVIPAPHHYSVNGKTLYYNYQDYIWTLCVQYGIEDYFTWLLCQFYAESGYKQDVVSHTDDYGICQLNGRYHEGFKKQVGHPEWDLIEDPYANMYVGVYLMARNIKNRGGDIDIAMTDYNAGGGYYAKNGIREVYCNRVRGFKNTLKQLD